MTQQTSPDERTSPRGGSVIDIHVHLAALPTKSNRCRLSKRMLKSPLAKFIAWTQSLPLEDPETANRLYLENLDRELSASKHVGQAVLLAMDGVYGADGMLDEARTDFLISNDCVLEAAEENPRFLAGVSINPNRCDYLEELIRCASRGASLVKVLPNAQVFDPADKRHKEFYRTLGKLHLPLLSHVGFEFSLIGRDQSLGDPSRLRLALDEGVTVVAAHGCSTGLFLLERYFDAMLDLVKRYKNFYLDTSALTLPNRVGALLRIRRRPELFERLLFGTDYPLPCYAYPALLASPGAYLEARRTGNRFDRHWRTLSALGLPEGKDAAQLLPRIQ